MRNTREPLRMRPLRRCHGSPSAPESTSSQARVVSVCGHLLANVVEQLERRDGQGPPARPPRCSSTRAVLHGEVEQFTDPLVLRNRGQELVQHVLQVVVVRANCEVATPQVRPPMTNSQNEPNQLPLVGINLRVVGGERARRPGEGQRQTSIQTRRNPP